MFAPQVRAVDTCLVPGRWSSWPSCSNVQLRGDAFRGPAAGEVRGEDLRFQVRPSGCGDGGSHDGTGRRAGACEPGRSVTVPRRWPPRRSGGGSDTWRSSGPRSASNHALGWRPAHSSIARGGLACVPLGYVLEPPPGSRVGDELGCGRAAAFTSTSPRKASTPSEARGPRGGASSDQPVRSAEQRGADRSGSEWIGADRTLRISTLTPTAAHVYTGGSTSGGPDRQGPSR